MSCEIWFWAHFRQCVVAASLTYRGWVYRGNHIRLSCVPGKIMQDIVHVRTESYIGKDRFGVTTGKRKKALITT